MAETTAEQLYQQYQHQGWCLFEHDNDLLEWVIATLPVARAAIAAPQNKQWLRHGETWFAGVNVLHNDSSGQVENGLALQGTAKTFVENYLAADMTALDRAQISVCYPGYPKLSAGESNSAFNYRLKRDAAHIDGLLAIGPKRERYLREHHDYILAIPMTECSANAAPFVLWDGSHKLAYAAFSELLNQFDENSWAEVALTECYHALRKQIFAECPRLEIALKPGQALLAHRLILHGTAPWHASAHATKDGRMICFFRPASISAGQWLRL